MNGLSERKFLADEIMFGPKSDPYLTEYTLEVASCRSPA